MVSATLAPDADVSVGGYALAKVQNPELLKHCAASSRFKPNSSGGTMRANRSRQIRGL